MAFQTDPAVGWRVGCPSPPVGRPGRAAATAPTPRCAAVRLSCHWLCGTRTQTRRVNAARIGPLSTVRMSPGIWAIRLGLRGTPRSTAGTSDLVVAGHRIGGRRTGIADRVRANRAERDRSARHAAMDRKGRAGRRQRNCAVQIVTPLPPRQHECARVAAAVPPVPCPRQRARRHRTRR